jgi:hypothetical protein
VGCCMSLLVVHCCSGVCHATLRMTGWLLLIVVQLYCNCPHFYQNEKGGKGESGELVLQLFFAAFWSCSGMVLA